MANPFDPNAIPGDDPDGPNLAPAAAGPGAPLPEVRLINPNAIPGDDPVAPVPVASVPGTGLTPGQIPWTCVFTFPPQPGQSAGVNTGQTVTTVVLGSTGQPVVMDGVPQAPSTLGVYPDGTDAYGCTYSCPPGFTGSALATITSGPNTGQTDAQPINLGAAVDLSGTVFEFGPPLVDILAGSSVSVSGSADVVSFLVTGNSLLGNALSPTGNPVSIAFAAAGDTDIVYYPAQWLFVLTGQYAGNYAQIAIGTGTPVQLAPGYYNVFGQIGGTQTRQAADVLSVISGGLTTTSAPSLVFAQTGIDGNS